MEEEGRLARLDKKKVEKEEKVERRRRRRGVGWRGSERQNERRVCYEVFEYQRSTTNGVGGGGLRKKIERREATKISETKKNRSEKTTKEPERWREVQWIGEGKRLQGVLDSEGISDRTVPSTIRFLPRENLEFPSPSSQTREQVISWARGKYVDPLVYFLKNPLFFCPFFFSIFFVPDGIFSDLFHDGCFFCKQQNENNDSFNVYFLYYNCLQRIEIRRIR